MSNSKISTLYNEIKQWVTENSSYYIDSPTNSPSSFDNALEKTLTGSCLSKSEFLALREHAILSFYLKETTNTKRTAICINIIFDLTRSLTGYSSSKTDWQKALKIVSAYGNKNTFVLKGQHCTFNREKVVAEAILFFKKQKKISIQLQDGKVLLSNEIEKKITDNIEQNIKKIGRDFLFTLIKRLARKHQKKNNRLILQKQDQKELIPWGYLINLGVKQLRKRKPPKNADLLIKETFLLASKLCTLYKVQSFSMWQNYSPSFNSYPEILQEMALRDQIYAPEQCSPNNLKKLLNSFFSKQNLLMIGSSFDPSPLLEVSNHILETSAHNKLSVYTCSSIATALKLNQCTVNNALLTLSFEKQEINSSFCTPADFEKANFRRYPLIREGKYDYLHFLPSFTSLGFYEVLAKQAMQHGVSEAKLGILFEAAISSVLTQSGIIFHSSKKYKINKNSRKTLGIKSENGELDFIIETPNDIYFIEAKKKNLTPYSKSGNTLSLFYDLAESYIYSQTQALKAELLLTHQGIITFTDGTSIHRGSQHIHRISLTLFDYLSLCDSNFLSQFTACMLNCAINSTSANPTVLKKINNRFKMLSELYQKNLSTNNLFSQIMAGRLISFPMLIEMLSHSSCNTTFAKEINKTAYITIGTQDWYADYYYASKQ